MKGGEENVDFEKIYREYFRDVFLYVSLVDFVMGNYNPAVSERITVGKK